MSFLYLHIGLMALAILAKATAVSAAMFFRRRKDWFKVHKALNYTANAALLAGLAAAFLAVGLSQASALGLAHRLAGLATVLVAFAFLLVGRSISRQEGREAIASRKGLHRLGGRIGIALMPCAALLGLVAVGLL